MLPMRIVGKFESVATSSLAGSRGDCLPNATFHVASSHAQLYKGVAQRKTVPESFRAVCISTSATYTTWRYP